LWFVSLVAQQCSNNLFLAIDLRLLPECEFFHQELLGEPKNDPLPSTASRSSLDQSASEGAFGEMLLGSLSFLNKIPLQ
jgi:hypothetical protein